MNKYNFCHLHRHCEASIQDGVGKVEDGVQYAKEMDHKAVAITDHGNLISYVRFYNEARNQKIKHIFGLEAYICDDMTKKDKDHKQYNHCTILVKNIIGYQNLLKLNNISHSEGFYYRPRLDWNTLFKYKEGLIILSGCVIGRTCQYILDNEFENADAWTRTMKKEIGDDYYLELMASDFPEQRQCNKYLLELSKKFNIPGVLTGDAHYIRKEDYEAQKAMMLVSAKATIKQLEEQERKKVEAKSTGKTFDERDKIWIFSSDQYWMKNEDEMIESWKKWHSDYYPESLFIQHLNESGKIADKVEIVEMDTSYKIPKAIVPEGKTSEEFFLEKLNNGMKEYGFSGKKEYEERLKMEVSIIKEKGLVDYFLVNSDIIGWAKRNDVFVGPARGSAGGSLVCYLLDITEIDPLKYDLLFERFLDLGREEMPDIDTDFEIEERDKVKQYIAERYGAKHVANISALGTYKARNITRDIMRVFDYDPKIINEVSSIIPEDAIYIDDKLYINEQEFHNELLDNVFIQNPKIRIIASNLFGQIRHVSKHAAGVIVTDRPLDECVATMHVGGEVMTAWTEGIYRKELTQLNVLKLDILGLKTLTVLKKACKFAGINHRDLLKLDLNDEKVYEVITKADLIKGIFQFDSPGGRYLFGLMKPTQFDHIVALAALDRPGPLDSNMTFEYIERLRDKNYKFEYDHPVINEVLGETYGVIVYQEQLMSLAKKLSGFDPAQASWLRKNLVKIQMSKDAIKKVQKDRKVLKKMFIEGAIKNGAEKNVVEKIWFEMTKFARYGFNKSHTVAYAMISYWTMWMKVYHPTEFYAALLTYAKSEDKELSEIFNELKKLSITLKHPDINKSGKDFTPDPDALTIRFGLGKIKYLGIKAQDTILQNRPFESFNDLCERVEKRVLNKRAKEALIRAGALRDMGVDTGHLLAELHNTYKAKREERILPTTYTIEQQAEDEKTYLSSVISHDIKMRRYMSQVEVKYRAWLKQKYFDKNPEREKELDKKRGDYIDPHTQQTWEIFTGFVLEVSAQQSKTGNPMCVLYVDIYKDKSMRFYIMEWNNWYNVAVSLKQGDLIGLAIMKRKNKSDFLNVTHLQKL